MVGLDELPPDPFEEEPKPPEAQAEGEAEQEKHESCPVCHSHDRAANLSAQGMVLTGMKATLEGDYTTSAMLYETLTPWDAHVAIGLAAGFLHDLCLLTGTDLAGTLENYRQKINAAQAKAE